MPQFQAQKFVPLSRTVVSVLAANVVITQGLNRQDIDDFLLVGNNILGSATSAGISFNVSEDGGATWKAGANDYGWSALGWAGAATVNSGLAAGVFAAAGQIESSNLGGVFAAQEGSFRTWFSRPWSTFGPKIFRSSFGGWSPVTNISVGEECTSAYRGTNNAINGIRIQVNGGANLMGNFVLYGLRRI